MPMSVMRLESRPRVQHRSAEMTAQAPLLDLAGLTSRKLDAIVREREVKGRMARQIHRQVMCEGRFDPEGLGLGAAACASWRATFRFALPEVARVVSEDGPLGETTKFVLRFSDGYEAESVLIPMGDRNTLCVSSQVGCKMGCTFCETGRMGLLRHMTTAEIVSQLLVARHVLGLAVKNIVFMGMGEALDNAENVFEAIRVMNDDVGMQMAHERFTVCSVGHEEGLKKLMALSWKRLNVSISLNATEDAQRSAIMPVNRKTNLEALAALVGAYQPRKSFVLGVNYCLLPGINDTREDVTRIKAFCEKIPRVLVNVIPYNPGNQPLTRAPTEDEIDTFIGWIREVGLPVNRRITKGRTVMAACGQLGNVELRAQRRSLRVVPA
jgi:23S rRNA (adenine2503-C2)-methyltransferase